MAQTLASDPLLRKGRRTGAETSSA